MGSVYKKLKQLINRVTSFLPIRLPAGTPQLDAFIKSILKTYNLPDKPSYYQAVATMIMHLPPTQHRASKRFFAKSIMKAMANEIAYGKIQEIRDAEKKSEELKNKECKQEPVSEPEE